MRPDYAARFRANDTKFAFLRAARPPNLFAMSEPVTITPDSRVHLRTEGEWLLVELQGVWRITEPRPSWAALVENTSPVRLKIVWGRLGAWDSALLLFVFEVRQWCRVKGIYCDLSDLPDALQKLLRQLVVVNETRMVIDRSRDFLTVVGLAAQDVWGKTKEIATFVGECVISAVGIIKRPHKFRWRDCLDEMQQCGAMALPIVSLIGLLVGLIMAYQSAVLMRQFGADIYVADAVGLVMVREMGAMMTAIILAGRTGAAFAATLGNMKAGEEIDALQTLGIRPVDFLVMPRLVALGLMMPLLALYASGLGILGGMAVSLGLLDIPPTAYWVETQSAIDMSDVSTGLIKASFFGVLVGLAGCHRGLRAERSAAGVGKAATSAVVMGLLLIIVSDALFAVIFNIFGW
jgi:phospholipid/cholesterol/gamma-HCH transport system permease protein